MPSICRTCLQEIEDSSEVYNLSVNEPNIQVLTLGQKLAACVPELVLDSTVNPVLCWSCTTALRCAFGFRQQCLESEQRIKNHLQKSQVNVICDLQQVVQEATVSDDQICVVSDDSLPSNPVEVVPPEGEEIIIVDTYPSQSEELSVDFNGRMSSLLRELLQNKPYKCNFCDYETIKCSKFELHQRTHAKEFKCMECYSSFASSEELDNHLQIHVLTGNHPTVLYDINPPTLKRTMVEQAAGSSSKRSKTCL